MVEVASRHPLVLKKLALLSGKGVSFQWGHFSMLINPYLFSKRGLMAYYDLVLKIWLVLYVVDMTPTALRF